MTMPFKEMTMYPSDKEDENDEIISKMKELREKKQIKMEVAWGTTKYLRDDTTLPFTRTDEGHSEFGKDAVIAFLNKYIALPQ